MADNIIIRPIAKKDCRQVAKLHKTKIHIGFLSTLGVPFIELIYGFMVGNNRDFCVIAEVDRRIAGFISGTVDSNIFYREFIRRNFLKIVILLLPRIFDFSNMKKILGYLFYMNKLQDFPSAEFLSIVVEADYRNKGIAAILLNELKKIFKEKGIDKFKSFVHTDFVPFFKFYEIMGAAFYSEVAVNKGVKWRAYVWNV